MAVGTGRFSLGVLVTTAALRLRRCERLRGLIPNIVGVDFYDQGDVLGAVNVINGLPATAKPALPTT